MNGEAGPDTGTQARHRRSRLVMATVGEPAPVLRAEGRRFWLATLGRQRQRASHHCLGGQGIRGRRVLSQRLPRRHPREFEM